MLGTNPSVYARDQEPGPWPFLTREFPLCRHPSRSTPRLKQAWQWRFFVPALPPLEPTAAPRSFSLPLYIALPSVVWPEHWTEKFPVLAASPECPLADADPSDKRHTK